MSCECPNDFLPLLSSIPGPRGAAGAPGASTSNGAAGLPARSLTTSSFVMPASGATVTVSLDQTEWLSAGLGIYVENAGYFSVVSYTSLTAVIRAQATPSNATSGVTIPTGRRVTSGAIVTLDSTALSGIDSRVSALEATPGGVRTFYGASFPSSAGLRVGDIAYRTDEGNKVYRWDGSGWVPANKVLELADFGTGIRPIVKVSALPTSGYADGDFVWLNTDGKLYRRVAGIWTKAIPTGDLTGTVDASTFIVDGTIIAQKLGANSVTAAKVGANQIITQSANIGEAVITDAHISNLSAGKITAGDIQAVNLGYTGRIFHPLAYTTTGVAAIATATVSSGVVTTITVTSSGTLYASPPVVTISGAGGTGAIARAEIANGSVVKITVVNGGSGYTSAPSVTVAPNYSYRYFRSVEFATAASTGKVFASGNALTTGYSHATPVLAYCPGNSSWSSGTVTACPDALGKIRVVVQARFPGYSNGPVLIYCQKNTDTPVALAAIQAPSSGTATISCSRELTGFSVTDLVKIYAAPADATGVVTAATCGVEIDVTLHNW